MWDTVLEEVAKIEAKGELIVLLGDLNAHIGHVVKGNNDRVSFGGKLLLDFLSSDKYCLVNATDKCTGGPFTCYDPAAPDDEKRKYVLDLCIVSSGAV